MKLKAFLATTITGLSIVGTSSLIAADLKTDAQKQSYSIGYMQGAQIKSLRDELKVDLDPALIQQGMQDALKGSAHGIKDEEMKASLDSLRKEIMEKERTKMEAMFKQNKEQSDLFMKENAAKPGVKTLASGLQYKVVKASSSNAASPTMNDTVTVKYKGMLINGESFDSSGETPATLAVNGVIKGWQEALMKMKPGDHWEIFVPADLAYGERGAPPKIMPNSALIFDLELVKVDHKKK